MTDDLPGDLAVELAGETVLLLAAKALYWPRRQTLCIADAHFGKAAAYRALGQPVPPGTTAANLRRLDALLQTYPATQLIFLGDFLHAPESHAVATLAALCHWRQQHTALKCTLIRGNHDLRAGDPPPGLMIQTVDEPLLLRPFALRHTPLAQAGYHVIAGHEHPVFHLRGKGRQRLRLPCFHSTAGMTVLPAYGEFTGGHAVEAAPDQRIFVTDGTSVWSLPPHPVIASVPSS